jgi:DNA-binding NtrC family response regulator
VLADHFLRRFNTAYGRAIVISPETMHAFMDHSWPGNIRELENIIKRMVVLGSALSLRQMPASIAGLGTPAPAPSSGAAQASLPVAAVPTGLKTIAWEAARAAERLAIETALDRGGWNRGKAAPLLQISYATLRRKIVDCELARRGLANAGMMVT